MILGSYSCRLSASSPVLGPSEEYPVTCRPIDEARAGEHRGRTLLATRGTKDPRAGGFLVHGLGTDAFGRNGGWLRFLERDPVFAGKLLDGGSSQFARAKPTV